MTFEIIPAHDVPLAAQAVTFTEAFRGYVGGRFAMDAGRSVASFRHKASTFATAGSRGARRDYVALVTSRVLGISRASPAWASCPHRAGQAWRVDCCGICSTRPGRAVTE